MTIHWTVRLVGLALLSSAAAILPSCEGGGHFTLFGYSTKPNYDTKYHSVSVPIFKNKTYMTVTPVVGLDMDLTRAVIREIEQKTPYKVKQCDADTELTGTIITFTKSSLVGTQMNYPREVETTLTCEIVWMDLRTGEPISRRARSPGGERDPDPRMPILAVPDNPRSPRAAIVPGTPTLPGTYEPVIEPDPEEEKKRKRPVPLLVRSVAQFRPELGESITTALQANVNRLAEQIVSAMEMEW